MWEESLLRHFTRNSRNEYISNPNFWNQKRKRFAIRFYRAYENCFKIDKREYEPILAVTVGYFNTKTFSNI